MDPGGRFNPFLGLRPFEERDEELFFGREEQVDELVGRLRRRRLIAVVGTSGSGKSSLVRAGLLPALHGGFMAGAGSRWYAATLRPGTQPIANLAEALEASGVLGPPEPHDEVRAGLARAALDRGALGLVDLLRDSQVRPGDNVLIVVDQFEELFRFKQENVNEAAAFVKLLMAAAAYPDLRLYVVLTMRSDFLGECAEFAGLPEAINDGLYLVPRMSWDQLRRAIVGPAGVAGAEIEPALVTRLLNDLGDNPDQLPVLQHALMRTWDLRSDLGAAPRLGVADYARTGGLERALSEHGDAVYGTLDDRGRQLAERLFKCITELGSDNRGIRRPTRFDDACAIVGASRDELGPVIEAFRAPECSFLTPSAGPIADNTVIDIAHESLMRIWQRLTAWVDEEAQSAQEYRRLATDAELHRLGKAALWRDPGLANAEHWRAETMLNDRWARHVDPHLDFLEAVRFLDRSVEERDRERGMRTRRTRIAIAGLAGAVLLLTASTAWAMRQREAATAERRDALVSQSRFLTRDAESAVAQGDAVTGMLIALEALPEQLAHPDRPFVNDAEYALEDAVANQHERRVLRGHDDVVAGAAFSPDGRRVVSASADKTVRLWDATSGAQLAVLRGHLGTVYSAMFSADGRRIVSASADTTVRVWDGRSGAQLAVLRGHRDRVYAAAFSTDGRRIVSASADKTVRVWDARNGAQLAVLRGHDDRVLSAAFSPDGRRIVSASADKTVRVWDAKSGAQLAVLRGHEDRVYSAAFSPDGRRIVSASADKAVRVWDATSGAQLAVLRDHDDRVYSAAFSTDGRRIVSASADRTVRVWDARSGDQLAVLRGHDDPVNSAAFSTDGRRIVSASDDKTVRLWDATSGAQLAILRGHDGPVYSAAFSTDGRRIVSASADTSVRVWGATSGAQLVVLRGHDGQVSSAAFSPDGRRIVSASADKTVRVWAATSGAQIAVLRGHGDWVYSAAFSTDGRRIVSASADKTVRIWAATSGAQLAILRGHDDLVSSAAFSPDGRRIVSASADKTVRLWDATSGAQLVVLRGHDGRVNSAAFSTDGRRIVSASDDTSLRVWDATSGAQLAVLRGHDGQVNSAAFSPDGRRIVSASADKTVRLWDATSGAQLAVLRGHDGPVNSAAFSPDGRRIVSASGDKTVRVWDATSGVPLAALRGQALIDAARGRVPRQLSAAQRAQEFLTPSRP